MIEVRFFGTARINFDKKTMSVEASTVKELMEKIAADKGVDPSKLKEYLIYVNEVNIDKLKRFRTKLNDGDKVMFLSPSSGG